MFEHGVKDGEQLVHAGGEGYLIGLACGQEALVEGPDHGVMAAGHEGGHVQGRSDLGTPTPHRPSATQGATVPVAGVHSKFVCAMALCYWLLMVL